MNEALHQEIAKLRAANDQLLRENVRLKMAPDGRVSEADAIIRTFNLPYTQADILLVLSDGKAVSRKHLINKVCRSEYVTEKTIDVHICRLRKAIAPLKITTVQGFGYRLEGENLAAVRAVIGGVQ